jgi:hypothetical protein
MSARFRVGDKVVVKGYVHERGEYYTFAVEMDEYIGRIATVTRSIDIDNCQYIRLDIDDGYWSWHPAWLAYPNGRVDIYEC